METIYNYLGPKEIPVVGDIIYVDPPGDSSEGPMEKEENYKFVIGSTYLGGEGKDKALYSIVTYCNGILGNQVYEYYPDGWYFAVADRLYQKKIIIKYGSGMFPKTEYRIMPTKESIIRVAEDGKGIYIGFVDSPGYGFQDGEDNEDRYRRLMFIPWRYNTNHIPIPEVMKDQRCPVNSVVLRHSMIKPQEL
jgi:hypothetical protein